MAQFYIEISNDLNEWEKLNFTSPQSNPFQSISWLMAYCETFNLLLKTIFVKKGDVIVAGLIVPVKKKLIFTVSTPLLFTYYSGVLFNILPYEKRQKQIIERNQAILKIHEYLKNNFQLFILKLHHTVNDVRQFVWLGYKVKPRHTLVLDISSIGEVWDGLSNSLKRKVKEAEEKGFRVVKTDDVEILSMQQILSYERKGGKFFLEFKDLKNLLAKLVQNGIIEIYHVLDKSGEVIASRGISVWNGKAYDVIAGATNKEINASSHFLVWKIIEELSSKGIREFDFCGADIESIAFFKTQFGGDIKISFEVGYAKGFLKIFV